MKKYHIETRKIVGCAAILLLLAVLGAGILSQRIGRQEVDVIMFAGQSNMSGIGDASKAPEVPEGWGYEFRAITDPTRLYPLREPFGENENNPGKCDDTDLLERTGSLVSAFVNAYYEQTQTPVVAVSASRGSSKLKTWRKLDNGLFLDAGQRLDATLQYLSHSNQYKIRHVYMVWLQGEGDSKLPVSDYKEGLADLVKNFQTLGLEKCFIIRVGPNLEKRENYLENVIAAQTELCKESPDFIMASLKTTTLKDLGYMQDQVHYTQEGYNLVGEDAGRNAGIYAATGEEPSMEDPYYGGIYEGYGK